MSKNKTYWLNRSLFDSPYYYRLCVSEKSFIKQMKRLKMSPDIHGSWMKNDHCGATLHRFEHPKHGLIAIVCIKKNKKLKREQVYALLVHEAEHLWRYIKNEIGEDHPAVEQEAYALQRISQELMFSYKEQTR